MKEEFNSLESLSSVRLLQLTKSVCDVCEGYMTTINRVRVGLGLGLDTVFTNTKVVVLRIELNQPQQ